MNNNDKFAKRNNIVLRFFAVITGLVPVILVQQVTYLVNKLALLLHKYRFSPDSRDKPVNDGCRGRWFSTFSQCGRSMIEMLGVLAIIAVLSVGGIAGYSKAMLNYKLNKSVEAHRDVIFGLIQYSDRLQPAEGENLINEEIAALGLKPDNWRKNGIYLTDDVNNTIFIGIYGNDKHIGYEIRMPARAISHTADGRVVQSYPYHFCVAAIKQLILPLSEMIDEFSFYRTKSGWDSFYGSKECGQTRKCISQINVSDIYKECQTCGTEDGEGCSIILKLQ